MGLLLVVAVAAYAVDRANSDKIADGVRVGGISIGGLSTDQARHRLENKLVGPLDKPVTVTFEGKKYVLSQQRLQLHADVSGMVDAALAASRSGGFPARVWRYTTGGSVDREITPEITYSSNALDEFVNQVAHEIDRPAQDATVAADPGLAEHASRARTVSRCSPASCAHAFAPRSRARVTGPSRLRSSGSSRRSPPISSRRSTRCS